MNPLIKAVAVAAIVAAPAVSFAQSNQQPLTRAQVRADLIQVEQAGYKPADWMHYPDNIQAAEAKIHAQDSVAAQADTTGYGNAPAAKSQAGLRAAPPAANDPSSIYFGH